MASKILRLVITGDSKQAVRAIEDVETASDRSARRVADANRRQASGFDEVHGSASRLHERIGLMAGGVGLGGLAIGFSDVLKNGMAWQQQLGTLRRSLVNTHAGGTQTLDMMSRAAEMGSTKGGFTAPDELQALAQFTTLTKNANQAVSLNTTAMNLARGTGLGYTQAQRMIGQVLTGNVGRLQRYLGIIQPVKTNVEALTATQKRLNPTLLQHAQLMDKQATAQKALSLIQAKYGGQMATFSRSATGQMSDLRNSVEVLTASLGTALLPAFQSLISVLTDAARWMMQHKTATMVAVGAVAALTVGTLAYSAAADVAKLATVAFAATSFLFSGLLDAIGFARVGFIMLGVNATAAWAAATLGLSLLIAGVVLAVTHFSTFKRIVGNVWKWFTGAVGTAAGALKSVFEPPIKWLFHAIKWIVDKVLWLPRELAKLNPFGGNSAATRRTIAKAGPFPATTGRFGPVIHRATGGTVGGYGTADNVPALLTPGEYVMKRSTAQAIGSHVLDAINASGHLAGAGLPDRDIVINLTAHLNNRIVAEETARYVMRRHALA